MSVEGLQRLSSNQISNNEINFTVYIKKDKKETQIMIDNKDEDLNPCKKNPKQEDISSTSITIYNKQSNNEFIKQQQQQYNQQ